MKLSFDQLKCDMIDRCDAAYLAQHPESPRYCYTCQEWLADEHAARSPQHDGHSIH